MTSTGALNQLCGHFVTEVWNERFSAWAMMDPNLDVVFFEGERPLGVGELYERSNRLAQLASFGPGMDYHRARFGKFVEEHVLTGTVFRLNAVWPRNDFLSHPELTPPSHGQVCYHETDLVWRRRHVRDQELDMFPFHADEPWFQQPPPAQ